MIIIRHEKDPKNVARLIGIIPDRIPSTFTRLTLLFILLHHPLRLLLLLLHLCRFPLLLFDLGLPRRLLLRQSNHLRLLLLLELHLHWILPPARHVATRLITVWWCVNEYWLVFCLRLALLLYKTLLVRPIQDGNRDSIKTFLPLDAGLLLEKTLKCLELLAEVSVAKVFWVVDCLLTWRIVVGTEFVCVRGGVALEEHQGPFFDALSLNLLFGLLTAYLVHLLQFMGDCDFVLETSAVLVQMIEV